MNYTVVDYSTADSPLHACILKLYHRGGYNRYQLPFRPDNKFENHRLDEERPNRGRVIAVSDAAAVRLPLPGCRGHAPGESAAARKPARYLENA